jgi:hypothetical protein
MKKGLMILGLVFGIFSVNAQDLKILSRYRVLQISNNGIISKANGTKAEITIFKIKSQQYISYSINNKVVWNGAVLNRKKVNSDMDQINWKTVEFGICTAFVSINGNTLVFTVNFDSNYLVSFLCEK